jgi:trans-aconitate methyltransferase
MDNIIKTYKDAFSEHGDSPASVLFPKGRQNDRFFALTKNIIPKENFSLLDFGCGLAHLKTYLDRNFTDISYTGADLVDDFITDNKKRFPESSFYKIKSYTEITDNYDYIVASGTFSILYSENPEEHKKLLFEILEHLFSKSNNFLAVNFMTDNVDFIQENAYHQNVTELYNFIQSKLSKRLIIDQSYMPYEFTATIYKNQTILRPENIYSV